MKKINIYFLVVMIFLVALPQDKVEAACSIGEGVLTFGQTSLAIKNMQTCLSSQGYGIPAGATGYYGVQTKLAVQKFYANKLGMPHWHGLSVGPMGREKLLTETASAVLPTTSTSAVVGYKPAGSSDNFIKYVRDANNFHDKYAVPALGVESQSVTKANALADGSSPQRVSETTVQISGVDEPDIVKTDGKNIFYSRNNWFGLPIMPMLRTGGMESVADKMMIAPYPVNQGETTVVNAFPPTSMVVSNKIKETGEMLLDKSSNTLVIFAQPNIVAYDVTKATTPKKLWIMPWPKNSSMVTARLKDGKVYLVSETWVDQGNPCEIVPMKGVNSLFIPCADIYVPTKIEPVSNTYSIFKINPKTGAVENKLAFAGDGIGTTVMVSKDNIYLATRAYTEPASVMLEVIVNVVPKYFSAEVAAGVNKIKNYDISPNGKFNEIINVIIQGELNKMSPDKRLATETGFNNEVENEMAKRVRDLETTRISRIALDDLSIKATGLVSGSLLNQFSLDEYQGNLRVSTTVGGNSWLPWGQRGNSVNDVYVLDSNLKKKGEVLDLGKGERIYSTRFMGDQGYVVTFKQIDPFYVLDLSNPSAPKLSGELKIPGYSSYLEKITDDLVLGVGREDNNVKLSLFDVSVASSPKEVAKYLLKDEWSEVENNHHAFMLDSDHKTFFIPGGKGGYFFDYSNNNLKLLSTVAQNSVSRALYIDNYYYLVGNEEIKVVDLKTWKEINKLILK